MQSYRRVLVGRPPADVLCSLSEAEMWTTIGLATAGCLAVYTSTGIWQLVLVPIVLCALFALANQTSDDDAE